MGMTSLEYLYNTVVNAARVKIDISLVSWTQLLELLVVLVLMTNQIERSCPLFQRRKCVWSHLWHTPNNNHVYEVYQVYKALVRSESKCSFYSCCILLNLFLLCRFAWFICLCDLRLCKHCSCKDVSTYLALFNMNIKKLYFSLSVLSFHAQTVS